MTFQEAAVERVHDVDPDVARETVDGSPPTLEFTERGRREREGKVREREGEGGTSSWKQEIVSLSVNWFPL